MHSCVVRPWQGDHPRPRRAVHLRLDGLQLVRVGAVDRGQVAPLLHPVQGVGAGAQPELRVLVQGRAGRRRR